MKISKLYVLLLLVQICCCNFLFAQGNKVIELTEQIPVCNLAEGIYLLEDKTHSLTFDEVKFQQDKFVLNTEATPNLGFTKSDWWFKITLKNTCPHELKYVLNIPYPFINQLDLYVADSLGKSTVQTVGDHFNFDTRKVNHKYFLFPIVFQNGEQKIIYGKVYCDGEATSLPMQLESEQALDQHDNNEQILLGLYYGILFFALVLSIFLGITLREKENIYYVVYVIGAILFQGSLDGLTFQFVWPNLPWLANHIIPLSAGVSLFALIKFSQVILNIQHWFVGFNKVLTVLLVLIGLTAVASILPNPFYGLSIPIISVFALLSDVLLFASALLSFRKGNKTAKYFLVSFSILLIAIIIAQLKNFGILPRVFVTEYGMQIGSAIELILLSFALAERVKTLREEKELAQAELFKELAERAKMQEEENIRLEQKVNERTVEVVKQKEIIEEKNKDITDSINYARRIQRGILPSENILRDSFKEHFVIYHPKDIVSGDFYWFANVTTTLPDSEKQIKFSVVSAIDCTGHGVPGAFMSMVGNTILNQTLKNPDVNSPADVLNFLNSQLKLTLKDKQSGDVINDGMDMCVIAFNHDSNMMYASGANNPTWVVREKKHLNEDVQRFDLFIPESGTVFLIAMKSNKQPVGSSTDTDVHPFTNSAMQMFDGDKVYLFTDGYCDQFGGNADKKYTTKRFKNLLCSNSDKSLNELSDIIWNEHKAWRGATAQVDDICIVGFKV